MPLLISASVVTEEEPFVVKDHALMRRSVHEILEALQSDEMLDELFPRPGAAVGDRSAPISRWKSVRSYLDPEDGDGYWETFFLSRFLMLSITDAIYRRNVWYNDEGVFKLRFMISGQQISPKGDTILGDRQVALQLFPAATDKSVCFRPGLRTQMVVIHCRRPVFEERLGLDLSQLPPPLDAFCDAKTAATTDRRIGFNSAMWQAAREVMDSRYRISADLRAPYLDAKMVEMLCLALHELASGDSGAATGPKIPKRDLQRIADAREYLESNLRQPPPIAVLARIVGTNQTKLKKLFKQVTGVTVYGFVLQRRMETAANLLRSGTHGVSETAYAVGYEYASNFTAAFKRFFGELPSSKGQERAPDKDDHP